MNDILWLGTGVVVAGALMALAMLIVAIRKRRAAGSGRPIRAADRENVLAPSGLEWGSAGGPGARPPNVQRLLSL